jgi:hypothetical protein
MIKRNSPLKGIKDEFAEGYKALGCLITGIILIATVFSIVFELIKNMRR